MRMSPFISEMCKHFMLGLWFVRSTVAQRKLLSPATSWICHFSKWLCIRQNDSVVLHCLNSAQNVINLYKSQKTKSPFRGAWQWQTAWPLARNDVWLSARAPIQQGKELTIITAKSASFWLYWLWFVLVPRVWGLCVMRTLWSLMQHHEHLLIILKLNCRAWCSSFFLLVLR